MDDSLKRVEVKVQPKSGFDKSFGSMGTSKCGTITPIFFDEVIPNSTVNLKLALSATLPPLASETFMKCSLKCEAFFVPMRLLFGSFEDWFCDNPISYAGTNITQSACPPVFNVQDDAANSLLRLKSAGGLADYLGMRAAAFPASGAGTFSALPFLAYHRVYDDWYRRADLQKPVFSKPKIGTAPAQYLKCAPYLNFDDTNYLITITGSNEGVYASGNDNYSFFLLRQRNFDHDYFTIAKTDPQWGAAHKVDIVTSGGTSSFTIASLRAQNSLQQFSEQNALVSPREIEVCKVRYGADLSDGVAQRSLLLGTAEFELYSKGIYVSADNNAGSSANPFASNAGGQLGSAYASGSNFIIDKFTANEPGYIFVMATLVPRVTYSSGIRRVMTNYIGLGSIVNMPNPLLQNTGNEPIYTRELNGDIATGSSIFGYVERYAWMKTRENELHGLLRDGNSLASFALQRTFASGSTPAINSAFIQIPKTYMDQVANVSTDISTYGYWYDAFFDYKVSMPLAKFSIPSLQNPAYEHGYTVNVKRNGISL